MEYKRRGSGSRIYEFPPEIVWSKLVGGNNLTVDPLADGDFDSREPDVNTVFTKMLRFEINKIFSFRLKSRMYFADWTVELEQLSPCRTRVTVDETVEFRGLREFLACGGGRGMRGEIKYYFDDLDRKLEELNKKLEKKHGRR